MIQLDIYCGLITKDDTSTIEFNTGLVERLALKYYPHGHTLISAQGRWDQGGVPITEPTTIIRLILDERVAGTENKARQLAGDYKVIALQESVMIIKTNIDASFV